MSKELKKLISAVNKKMNRTVFQAGSEDLFSDVKLYIPTGIPTVDIAIGGGIPVGRVMELYGKQKCGKSTFAISACTQAQKMGGLVVYFDSENALAKDRAKHMGLDLDNIIISLPSSIEEVKALIDHTVKVAEENEDIPFVFFVWDTPAFTLSDAERESGEFKPDMGKRAQRLRAIMRQVIDLSARSKVAFLAINHALDKVGATGPGAQFMIDVPGGSAFKFGASVQVYMKAREGKDDRLMSENDEDQVGQGAAFRIDKTRLSVPKREVYARLNYYNGFDAAGTVLDHLIDRKLLLREGNKYVLNVPSWPEPITFSTGPAGEKAFIDLYNSNPELQSAIHALMKAEYEAIIPWKSEAV